MTPLAIAAIILAAWCFLGSITFMCNNAGNPDIKDRYTNLPKWSPEERMVLISISGPVVWFSVNWKHIKASVLSLGNIFKK